LINFFFCQLTFLMISPPAPVYVNDFFPRHLIMSTSVTVGHCSPFFQRTTRRRLFNSEISPFFSLRLGFSPLEGSNTYLEAIADDSPSFFQPFPLLRNGPRRRRIRRCIFSLSPDMLSSVLFSDVGRPCPNQLFPRSFLG